MPWPASEIELARPIIPWLQEMQWDVYEEVQCMMYGQVADIVAIQGRIVWIIECKRSFGFTLLEQAAGWTQFAHYVSVAVPRPRRRYHQSSRAAYDGRVARAAMRTFGIGLLIVAEDGHIDEYQDPVLHRKAMVDHLRGICHPGMKGWAAAGAATGSHWTPFGQTCRDIALHVREHPGATLTEILAEVVTHYRTTSTARSCVAKWASQGKVKGVRVARDGRNLRFYPEEASLESAGGLSEHASADHQEPGGD